ncbi:MAG: M15 family metallopeptidase [Oscillospiraceae bacterium]|jgi:D-alanyl-D-alanine carboxypeptidase|nr:M15 family metallopeptidase [Oscillospiraceae bacterium]
MKKLLKVGNIAVLVLVVVAGIGLYTAYKNGKLPSDVSTTGTTVPSHAPTEYWANNATGQKTKTQTQAPAQTTAAKTSNTTQKNTVSASKTAIYGYDFPGIQPAIAAVNAKEWYLLLVNRDYALPIGYSPETAVCIKNVYPENRELDVRVAPMYEKMYKAARKDGAELIPYSGYRRTSTQETNFNNKIAQYEAKGYSHAQAVNLAAEVILPPGCSEHEAGLAMDITSPGVWGAVETFETTPEFKWLQAHAHEYGFILRYPKNKKLITKISYEPWHWRYVGVEAATVIHANGLCLEEYLAAH